MPLVTLFRFGYPQARVQSRHGLRPEPAHWRQLHSLQGLPAYIDAARTTPLRRWLRNISAQTSHHDMERLLRGQWCAYVAAVARWHPGQWRPAVLWLQGLAHLPAIRHLLAGNPAQGWMKDEPELRPLLSEVPANRRSAFEESRFAPLLAPWDAGAPLRQAWLTHWRALWPDRSSSFVRPLEQVAGTVYNHLHQFPSLPNASAAWRAREQLAERLEHLFRRHALHPAATFCHLALVGLDVERLRGDLVRRALFPAAVEDRA